MNYESWWKDQARQMQNMPRPASEEIEMRGYLADARKRRRRGAVALVVFVLAVAAWAWAGYAVGLAKGRGWRGAVIEGGCEITCRST